MTEVLDIAHEMGKDLLKAGAMDAITMRKLDELCLPEMSEFEPEDIKRIRKENNVSQAVFAAFLGIAKSTVQQWEQGKGRVVRRGGFLILLTAKG